MPAETTPHRETELTPGAAVLAWLWPGAGHISLGEKKRGLFVMAGVLFLFISGLLIGGVNVVDRRDDRLWFIAQIFCGPVTLAADYANQNLIKRPIMQHSPEELRDPDQWRTISVGHINEIGKLYVALAGLMNLVAILDALHFTPRTPPRRKRRATDAPDRDDARSADAGESDSGGAA